MRIEGDGDVAEICRLTCLERGVQIESTSGKDRVPVLRVDGRELKLEWLESNRGEVKMNEAQGKRKEAAGGEDERL